MANFGSTYGTAGSRGKGHASCRAQLNREKRDREGAPNTTGAPLVTPCMFLPEGLDNMLPVTLMDIALVGTECALYR